MVNSNIREYRVKQHLGVPMWLCCIINNYDLWIYILPKRGRNFNLEFLQFDYDNWHGANFNGKVVKAHKIV